MRRWLPWLGLLLAITVVALLTVRGDDDGIPLDPDSTGPLGAKALVVLLRELGADVRVTSEDPPAEATTAVLLGDHLSEERRDAVREWVRAGGTLLVADPTSELAPPIARQQGVFSFDPEEDVDADACDEPALRTVRRLGGPELTSLERSGSGTGCLRRGEGFLIVVRPEGDGTIVAVGGAAPFLNGQLDDGDGSVLATTVLAPDPEQAVVAVLDRGEVGGGDRSLLDLVDRRVKDGLWQLAIAFGVLVLWRARRFGRPVLEPQAVELPGNELVSAVGNLLQRARRRDQAADMLRRDLRRTLAERLGLPADAAPETLAAAAAARTPVDEVRVQRALDPRLLSDDRELVDLARAVHDIRREVTDVEL